MLYTFPDYYKEFTCIADQCEDTCCAGWEIVIDGKTLRKYRKAVLKARGKIRFRLLKSVKWHAGTFRRVENRRCAFLNDRNLCDIYSDLGPEYLCRTCRLYPRHVEEFEGVREVTLSISCPEVARMLMHKKEPVHFLEREKKGEEEYEDYDPFLYSKLVDAREVMLQILQDRIYSIEQRKVLIAGISHDLQKRIDQGHLFSCDEVLERYQTEKAREYVKKWCEEEKPERYPYVTAWYRKLYQLEILREEWEGLVCESEVLLYQKGAKEYERMRQEYENWLQQEFPEWEVQCEQLLVYFLMTYFCGAVYDGNAYAKTWMTLSCVSLIEELLMARWIKNEHMLCMEDVIEIVYRFSREIEHSDPNLEKMEETR